MTLRHVLLLYMRYAGDISSRFSEHSEANASEFHENLGRNLYDTYNV